MSMLCGVIVRTNIATYSFWALTFFVVVSNFVTICPSIVIFEVYYATDTKNVFVKSYDDFFKWSYFWMSGQSLKRRKYQSPALRALLR